MNGPSIPQDPRGRIAALRDLAWLQTAYRMFDRIARGFYPIPRLRAIRRRGSSVSGSKSRPVICSNASM